MTVRTFVVGALAATAVGAASWLLTLTKLDPAAAGAIGFLLFFLSFFVVTAGAMSLAGYAVRRLLAPQLLPSYLVRTSLRQGVMVSLFVVLLLLLQLWRLYRWWIALIAIVIVVSFELVFISYDRTASYRPHRAQA